MTQVPFWAVLAGAVLVRHGLVQVVGDAARGLLGEVVGVLPVGDQEADVHDERAQHEHDRRPDDHGHAERPAVVARQFADTLPDPVPESVQKGTGGPKGHQSPARLLCWSGSTGALKEAVMVCFAPKIPNPVMSTTHVTVTL